MSDQNVSDKYLWLEDLNSKESLQWVSEQNQKTQSQWMQGPTYEDLQKRSLQFLNQTDRLTTGHVLDNKVYHLWKDSKNPIGVLRVADISTLATTPKWQIVFDLDNYSKEQNVPTFLKYFEILKNGKRLLLSLSPEGKDAAVIKEWDLENHGFVANGFEAKLSKDSMIWLNQEQVIWASTATPTHCGYSSQVFLKSRGQEKEPQFLYQAPTTSVSAWGYPLHLDSGKSYPIVVHHITWNENEFFIYQNDQLQSMGLPRHCMMYGSYQDRIVIWLEKSWEQFPKDSVLIAKRANHFVDLKSTDFDFVFQPSQNNQYQDCAIFKSGIAVHSTENLKHQITIWTDEKEVQLPVPDDQVVTQIFSSFDKDQLHVIFQSFVQPPTWKIWKEENWEIVQSMGPQFDARDIQCQQEWAKSADGTKVPYWLVWNAKYSFPRPTLQYGYGGFLSSLFPSYLTDVGSLWLEKGGVYVLSQIRGGAEFGTEWHQAAILKNKQKSYDDFIAISEDLIRKGRTTAKMLSIQGRSNGGLLVGAVTMQRPDLYQAAIIEVPLLDMLRYVELPPGSSWIGEYGDPRDPEFLSVIAKYSPYQNIRTTKKYPSILIRTSRSDDRVHPGHARKMAARLQEYGHECWFYEETLGGHGSTPVQVRAEQLALIYHFLWTKLLPQGQS